MENEQTKQYEGLFTCPASDVNFASALARLNEAELQEFLVELELREDTQPNTHKGRIKAVEKALKALRQNSPEITALARVAQQTKAELAAIDEADKLYGGGQPYERIRLETEVRFYQDQMGASLIEIGKRLILLREHEKGNFLKVLENIEMSQRGAYYAIEAARKFGNLQTFASLERSKMIALTVLDDDEVKTLEEGGKVKGMTFDEIDRMTMSELRKNLRKAKENLKKEKEGREKDRAFQMEAIAQKELKINDLDLRLSNQQPPTKEQLALAELRTLSAPYTYALTDILEGIRKAHTLAQDAEKIPGVDALQLNEWFNQFDREMRAFHETWKAWTDEVDNAGPIAVGEINDADLEAADVHTVD